MSEQERASLTRELGAVLDALAKADDPRSRRIAEIARSAIAGEPPRKMLGLPRSNALAERALTARVMFQLLGDRGDRAREEKLDIVGRILGKSGDTIEGYLKKWPQLDVQLVPGSGVHGCGEGFSPSDRVEITTLTRSR